MEAVSYPMMMDDDDCYDDQTGKRSFLEDDIPIDTTYLVLSFLHYSDLQRLSVCSRRLNGIVSHAPAVFMEEACQEEFPRTTHRTEYRTTPHFRQREVDLFTERPTRLDERTLGRLLERYTHLTELHLAGLARVGDALFRMINQAPSASTLHSLTLNGAALTYWCPDVLQLPKLRRLRISGGSMRASMAILFSRTTELESLSIAQCSTLRDDQLQTILEPLSDSLKELNIQQCLRIRRPRIQMRYLERLSLMGCFALTELPEIAAPFLREINLSFCFRLNTNGIQTTVNRLPCLETLTLVKCPLLETLDLCRMPHLRLLNVNYCNMLSWLRVTDCQSLSVLENAGCVSLRTLILQGVDALEYFNASALPIRRLVVAAMYLLHLELENCKDLDDCLIRSPRLQRVNIRGR